MLRSERSAQKFVERVAAACMWHYEVSAEYGQAYMPISDDYWTPQELDDLAQKYKAKDDETGDNDFECFVRMIERALDAASADGERQ